MLHLNSEPMYLDDGGLGISFDRITGGIKKAWKAAKDTGIRSVLRPALYQSAAEMMAEEARELQKKRAPAPVAAPRAAMKPAIPTTTIAMVAVGALSLILIAGRKKR